MASQCLRVKSKLKGPTGTVLTLYCEHAHKHTCTHTCMHMHTHMRMYTHTSYDLASSLNDSNNTYNRSHLLRTFGTLGTFLILLDRPLFKVHNLLLSKYPCYPHFTNKETEAQRGCVRKRRTEPARPATVPHCFSNLDAHGPPSARMPPPPSIHLPSPVISCLLSDST